MYKYIPLLLILVMATGCFPVPSPQPSWRLVFQNDLNGRTIYGSRVALANALKRGSPIRVAWGEKMEDGSNDVEFATPDFTSLINDSDVVVQFPMSMIQTDYLDAHKAILETDPPIAWRALMSTDGHYHQFHHELATGKVTRVMYLRANMSWYAYVPVTDNRYKPELAIRNGIVLDSMIKK